ncbi:MAG TPA: hypothetical protein DEB09_01130 [Candidatus Magasanikbacteria bacterium]|nr:hypothetical protein [Candidatus Magasanikbacteria bacterium]
MNKKFILFICLFLFCFLAVPVYANMPSPTYFAVNKQVFLFEKGFVWLSFFRDLLVSLINFFLEFIILGFLLFKNNIFKIKNLFSVFITNMFTWFFFLGSTVLSVWYIFYLFAPSVLYWNPTATKNPFTLVMVEIIIFLIEAKIYVFLFKNDYPKKRIILSTLVANLISLIVPFIIF